MDRSLVWVWVCLAGCVNTADISWRTFTNCADAQAAGHTMDASYVVDPDGPDGEPPVEAWCDMNTGGGGWTLVYAYTFTHYDDFENQDNAVTPRPSWPADLGESVDVSTTMPTSPTDFGALDYSRWSEFGREFMVTSTINHWLICEDGSGSLARDVEGSITCTIEKLVATACTNEVPDDYSWASRGPALNGPGSHYYYWDGDVTGNWPTHDPCGTNDPNQLAGVSDARGAVYLR